MTADIRAAAQREDYPGQVQEELDERAFSAQREPMSDDRARLLFALGRSACGCCATVEQGALDEFDSWRTGLSAGITPTREQLIERISGKYFAEHLPGVGEHTEVSVPLATSIADIVLDLIEDLTGGEHQ